MTSRKTVGEILKAARLEKGISFEQVSSATKINPKYLKALESGDYSLFSSSLHIKGFIKNYAEFLDLNEKEVLAFWRREYNLTALDAKTQRKPLKPLRNFPISVGPAFFAVFGVLLLVLFFLGYLVSQYVKFSSPPKLLVSQPQGDMVVEESQVEVFGVTDPGAFLEVNGQEIVLGEGGEFLVKMPLQEGMNLVNIVAKNRFDKETKRTFKIFFEKPKAPPEPVPEPQESVISEVE